MEDDYITLAYAGGVPGADSNTYVLFDSSTSSQFSERSKRFAEYKRYILSLKNTAAGTLRAWSSNDGGSTWRQFFDAAVAAASTTRNNSFAIPTEPHANVKIDWVNGGVAQSIFYVQHALDDGLSTFRPTVNDSGSSSGAASTNVASAQLPAALGQTTKANSLPVTEASDSAITAAASVRAPIRNEILVIPVTTSNIVFNIPDGSLTNQPDWRGKYVEMFAESGDVYLQFSTGTTASVDETQASTLSTVNGRQSIAPQGNEAYVIPRGTSRPIPILSTFQTFALKGTVATKLRTQLAQT
jgi:hypothetical protein